MPSEILLVDDDHSVRETTSDLLGFTGAVVHTATSGNEARRFLEAKDVNLVITDLSMPDGDGKSLLAWIRSSPRHRNLKVVIMSAHAQREDIKLGLEAGADQYLTKPFNPVSFISEMKKHLESAADGADGRPTAS